MYATFLFLKMEIFFYVCDIFVPQDGKCRIWAAGYPRSAGGGQLLLLSACRARRQRYDVTK